jgi:hypothetical protein
VSSDEHPRATTIEALSAKLKPIVRPDGTITAGNASGVNDGAAALIVASEATAKAHGLTPRARILGVATAGVEPRVMGIGPVPATKKLLARLGLSIGDIDVVELNEAFAAQGLAVLRDLGLPDDGDHVNPNGGAIALGHPLGMSGARLGLTLVEELHRRRPLRPGDHVHRRWPGRGLGPRARLGDRHVADPALCPRGRQPAPVAASRIRLDRGPLAAPAAGQDPAHPDRDHRSDRLLGEPDGRGPGRPDGAARGNAAGPEDHRLGPGSGRARPSGSQRRHGDLAGQRRRPLHPQEGPVGRPLDPNFTGAGRVVTDAEGRYRYVTVRPGAYPWGNHHNAWRPSHIHLSLLGPAFATRLITQMYFPDDPLIEIDPIANAVPMPFRQRMVSRFDIGTTQANWALGYLFDVVLRGREATPFEDDHDD